MKSICIHKDGTWWSFMFEEGEEEQLLQTMLERAQLEESTFDVEDIVAIVKSYPGLFTENS